MFVSLMDILNTRSGGNVKRYHTVPILGENTNAHHSWNVAILLHKLHPEPRKELLLAALYHDVAEFYTGDTPANVKKANPTLAVLLENIEDELNKKLFIDFDLTEDEKHWLKCCDLLELILFCKEQREMGNKASGDIMFWRGLDYLEDVNPPSPVQKVVQRIMDQETRRK